MLGDGERRRRTGDRILLDKKREPARWHAAMNRDLMASHIHGPILENQLAGNELQEG
jgi:hypothetical protein